MADLDDDDLNALSAGLAKVGTQLGTTGKALTTFNTSLQAATKAIQDLAKTGKQGSDDTKKATNDSAKAVQDASKAIRDSTAKNLLAALNSGKGFQKVGQDLKAQFLMGVAGTTTASLGGVAQRYAGNDPLAKAFLGAFSQPGETPPAAAATATGGKATAGLADANATRAEAQAAKSTGFMVDLATEAGAQIRNSLGDVLYNALDGNFKAVEKSFRGLLRQIVADVAASQISKLAGGVLGWIGNTVAGLFGGGGGSQNYWTGGNSLTGGTYTGPGAISTNVGWPGSGYYARGGAFLAGRELHAFASGGIVTRPTLFPMARGAGLMGEAGPEAIMPLARDGSGRLGVRSDGGGGVSNQINITVNVGGDGSAQGKTQGQSDDAGRQLASMIESKVKDVLVREQRQGGILWRMQHG